MKGESEYKKRLWTEEEDRILMDSVGVHGQGNWNRVAKMAGNTHTHTHICFIDMYSMHMKLLYSFPISIKIPGI